MATDGGFDPVDLRIAEQLVKGEPTSVEDLVAVGTRVLGYSGAVDVGHDSAAEARSLLAAALGTDVDGVDEKAVPPLRARERYLSYVARRAAGEPIGLILGHVLFCGLEFKVARGTFMPRPSSELAVQRTLHLLEGRPAPVVVDLCTGVGAIALAVAREREDASVFGVDVSRRSLVLARRNARKFGVVNASFRYGDLYEGVPSKLHRRVDAIVGYIPFVTPSELPTLPAEVSEYEPLFALTDLSHDGMALLRRVVNESTAWLKPTGCLLVQLTEDVARDFADLCVATGFGNVDVVSAPDSWEVIVEARRG